MIKYRIHPKCLFCGLKMNIIRGAGTALPLRLRPSGQASDALFLALTLEFFDNTPPIVFHNLVQSLDLYP